MASCFYDLPVINWPGYDDRRFRSLSSETRAPLRYPIHCYTGNGTHPCMCAAVGVQHGYCIH